MMKFPKHIFWRPVSASRRDCIPVLVWDGYRYWIGVQSFEGPFTEQETGEEIYALCWADIPDPPRIERQQPLSY